MTDIIFILPEIKGGGAEKSVINLCKALEKEQDYNTHLIILKNKIEYNVDGIRIHDLGLSHQVSKKGIKRLTYRKKMAEKIDKYIVDNFCSDVYVFSNMIFIDKIMSQSRLNVFHIIRNSYSKPMLSGKSFIRQLFIKRNISKVYSKHPIIFVSYGAQNDFNEFFSPKTKQTVIHNAIDMQQIFKLADDYTVSGDYILHIGRFNYQKRHDLLLDIYSRTNKKIKLKLMGKGELEEEIKFKIRDLNLTSDVEFEDFNENPYPIIKNAKLVVLTSDFEGLPRVLMEATVLNKPIISFDCPGGIKELISNKECLVKPGYINEYAKKIDDAIEFPDRYKNEVTLSISFNFVVKEYKKLFELKE